MNNEEYLKLIETREKSQETIDLEIEPGIIWKVIPLNPLQAMVTGHLPLHLIKQFSAIKDFKNNQTEIAETLNAEDITKFLEFCRDVLYTNVVEPKFSIHGEPGTIPASKIPAAHFQSFMNWVSGGGQIASNSFRPSNKRPKQRR